MPHLYVKTLTLYTVYANIKYELSQNKKMNHNALTHNQADRPNEVTNPGAPELVGRGGGGKYILDPTMAIYPPSEIGVLSERDGTRFVVVDEITLPLEQAEDVLKTSSIAVIAAIGPTEETDYALIGLEYDAENKKKKVPHSEHWLHSGDSDKQLVIGRHPVGVDTNRLLGKGTGSALLMSSKHIKFRLAEDGKLQVDVSGTNGVWSRASNAKVMPIETSAESGVTNNVAGHVALEAMTRSDALQAVRGTLISPNNDRPHIDDRHKLLGFAETIIAAGKASDAKIVKTIVCDDMINGKPLPDIMGKFSASEIYDKKGQLLAIYKNDPDLARQIVELNIVGFHGSKSASLSGVLKHGLLSAEALRERGHKIGSGERAFSRIDGENTIRFADWREPRTIEYYSHINNQPITPEGLELQATEIDNTVKAYLGTASHVDPAEDQGPLVYNQLLVANDMRNVAEFLRAHPDTEEAKLIGSNFPVAYGLSATGYEIYTREWDIPTNDTSEQKKIVKIVPSDVKGEFAMYGPEVPIDDIPVIAVPEEKVAWVSDIVRSYSSNIQVVSLESLTENPYAPGLSVYI